MLSEYDREGWTFHAKGLWWVAMAGGVHARVGGDGGWGARACGWRRYLLRSLSSVPLRLSAGDSAPLVTAIGSPNFGFRCRASSLAIY